MSSITINGDTSGSVILQAPSVAGSTTLTLPTTTGTLVTSNAMPTGSVLQVVNATYSTQTTSTSNTLADSGLQAIITPSSSSNKILIMYTVPVQKNSGEVSNGISFGVTRNGTIVWNTEWLSYGSWTGSSVNSRAGYAANYLDSPSSTSALTYKLRFCETYGSAGVTICHDSSTATLTLIEVKG